MLVPGEVLSGRFRILKFVARGGMGEVYEALDLELRERVALKTIRPELAKRPTSVARFRNEIALAHRVTHQNVCRIFDLFHHRARAQGTGEDPAGALRDIVFLTMEFLDGITLAAHLRERGKLPEPEAFSIIEQVGNGLHAAHLAGVVHRDLKAANVVLSPLPAGGHRAVITDFGLALDPENSDPAQGKGLAGTPAYMAPEQIQGRPVSPATDIYAMGVLIYEIFTGDRPFGGTTTKSVISKHLHEAPVEQRLSDPGLGRIWDEVILRCLQREPADRFATTLDVVKTLRPPVGPAVELVTTVDPAASWDRRVPPRRSPLVWVAAGLGVAALGAGGYALLHRGAHQNGSGALVAGAVPGTSALKKGGERSLAVIGMKNLTGGGTLPASGAGSPGDDQAWVGAALAELLAAELSGDGTMQALPQELVQRMKLELQADMGELPRGPRLGQIRNNLGLDFAVWGSYQVTDPSQEGGVQLELHVIDTATGQSVIQEAEAGSASALPQLAAKLGARLRPKLNMKPMAEARLMERRRSIFPQRPEAGRAYSMGLLRLRARDAAGALTQLEQAATADAGDPLIHAALAETLSALGYDRRAVGEARQADQLKGQLDAEHRLAMTVLFQQTSRAFPPAIAAQTQLWALAPTNLEFGLKLASLQNQGNQPKDALATVARLRQLPPPAADDPRIDLAEADALSTLGRYKDVRKVAAQAVEKANARSAFTLLARARIAEAVALYRELEPGRALERTEEAERFACFSKDQATVVEAVHTRAAAFSRGGELANAGGALAKALKIERKLGNKRVIAQLLAGLGHVEADSGELSLGLAKIEEARAIAQELADHALLALCLDHIAQIRESEGRPADARSQAALAVKFATEAGNLVLRVHAGLVLYRVALMEADLPAARAALDRALAVVPHIGKEHRLADQILGRATLLLAEGRPDQAAPLAERMLDNPRVRHPYERVWAHSLLARIRIAQGRAKDAQAVLEQARPLVPDVEHARVRRHLVLTRAMMWAQLGNQREAREYAEAAAEVAMTTGWRSDVLRARFLLAQLNTEGHSREEDLLAVEKEAQEAGMVALAQRAALARQAPAKKLVPLPY
jgi:tetratricopeptide (TPR) repeat protein